MTFSHVKVNIQLELVITCKQVINFLIQLALVLGNIITMCNPALTDAVMRAVAVAVAVQVLIVYSSLLLWQLNSIFAVAAPAAADAVIKEKE